MKLGAGFHLPSALAATSTKTLVAAASLVSIATAATVSVIVVGSNAVAPPGSHQPVAGSYFGSTPATGGGSPLIIVPKQHSSHERTDSVGEPRSKPGHHAVESCGHPDACAHLDNCRQHPTVRVRIAAVTGHRHEEAADGLEAGHRHRRCARCRCAVPPVTVPPVTVPPVTVPPVTVPPRLRGRRPASRRPAGCHQADAEADAAAVPQAAVRATSRPHPTEADAPQPRPPHPPKPPCPPPHHTPPPKPGPPIHPCPHHPGRCDCRRPLTARASTQQLGLPRMPITWPSICNDCADTRSDDAYRLTGPAPIDE